MSDDVRRLTVYATPAPTERVIHYRRSSLEGLMPEHAAETERVYSLFRHRGQPMRLSDRPAGQGIVYISNTEMKYRIVDGDNVEVHLGEDFAFLVDVQVLGNGQYCGTVRNFRHSPHEVIDGIAVGATIQFEERHVGGCHTP